jgi:molybdopterin-guanine dinucleotide biosynthesis protein A
MPPEPRATVSTADALCGRPPGALDAIEAAMATGEQRLFRVLETLGPRIADEAELRMFDPELLTLFNVNTPADVAHAERIAYRDVS